MTHKFKAGSRGVSKNAISSLSLFILMTCIGNQGRAEDRQLATIDWKAAINAANMATRDDAKGLNSFRAAAANEKELQAVALPVLVPGTGPVRAAPKVRGQNLAYSSSYTLNGARLSILGSATSLVAPKYASAFEKAPDTSSEFEITEDGADLNFTRFGASYVLRISCQRPDDERCTSKEFLGKVRDSLIVVGGNQLEQSAGGKNNEGK